ncbi:MAG: FliM/FliN family flagellar motor switch protein, partial [Sphingomonadales bacterium]|nr:FliM/FliN family flagellar motor switch protein [Sphingomonadales bacterium]
EPIRELLLQRFMGEKFGRDTIWESHLATELWSTKVPLMALLDEQQMSLKEVMDFKVGQTLLLNATPDSEIMLSSGEVPMAYGKMGRSGNHVAIRVSRPAPRLRKKAAE